MSDYFIPKSPQPAYYPTASSHGHGHGHHQSTPYYAPQPQMSYVASSYPQATTPYYAPQGQYQQQASYGPRGVDTQGHGACGFVGACITSMLCFPCMACGQRRGHYPQQ